MSEQDIHQFPEIASELIAMSERDQAMRNSGQWDSGVDRANTLRMKEIVAQIGWPTRSKVGKQASFMAWLLAQHADHDLAFQKYCLELMYAQPSDEVNPCNIAYLEDRVRVAEERPQLYGTQFYRDSQGKLSPRPIEDIAHVDQRRAEVGLETLAAYTKTMEHISQKKSSSSSVEDITMQSSQRRIPFSLA